MINLKVDGAVTEQALEVGDVIEVESSGKKFLAVEMYNGSKGILNLDTCTVGHFDLAHNDGSVIHRFGDITVHKSRSFYMTLHLQGKNPGGEK